MWKGRVGEDKGSLGPSGDYDWIPKKVDYFWPISWLLGQNSKFASVILLSIPYETSMQKIKLLALAVSSDEFVGSKNLLFCRYV